MTDTQILTSILTQFAQLFNQGIKNVIPYAMGIIGSLIAIDLVLSHGINAAEKNHIELLVQNILKYGFFVFFIQEYKSNVDTILDGFIFIGLKAGGDAIPATVFTDPSYIMELGIKATEPVYTFVNKAGTIGNIAAFFPNFFFIAVALMINITFFIMAILVFVTYLQFYIVGAVMPILIPFGVFKYTSFLAEAAWRNIVSAGIKLMVLSFVMCAVIPLIENMALPATGEITNADCLRLFGGAAACALLSWQAPALAASLASGGPSLGQAALSTVSSGANAIKTTLQGNGGGNSGGSSDGYKSSQDAVRAAANVNTSNINKI